MAGIGDDTGVSPAVQALKRQLECMCTVGLQAPFDRVFRITKVADEDGDGDGDGGEIAIPENACVLVADYDEGKIHVAGRGPDINSARLELYRALLPALAAHVAHVTASHFPHTGVGQTAGFCIETNVYGARRRHEIRGYSIEGLYSILRHLGEKGRATLSQRAGPKRSVCSVCVRVDATPATDAALELVFPYTDGDGDVDGDSCSA